MRNSRRSARLLACAGATAVFTAALTCTLVTPSYAGAAWSIVQTDDGLGWSYNDGVGWH